MKRLMALVLCLFMVCSFTACRKNTDDGSTSVIYEYEYVNGSTDKDKDKDKDNGKDDDKGSGHSGDKDSDKGNSGEKITVTNNCYSSGTKIAKDKITLKVLVRDYTGGVTNYNNCALTKYIEKNMNIKLQFTTCSAEEVSTKMTLAYASGTNPYDIYMGMAPAGSFHGPYIKQGKVTKLDDYIKKYGKNIQHVFDKYPETQYLCTAEDGGIYMLPMLDDQQNYSDLLYINKKWLGSVGKSMPTTTDQLKAVLEAFKQKYPGKTPFVANSNAGEDVGPSLFGPFGISTYHNWNYIDQSSDQIKYTCISDEYRNGLRYYNSLFSAGLMKFAASKDEVRKMTDADSVGLVLTDSPKDTFNANKFNSDWTMVPVLNASSGGTWANVKYENTWAEWFVLTKSCKYPECAVRLADWFYSKEGTLTGQYGPKGTYWDYDTKGNVVLDSSKIPNGKSESEYIYTLTPSYCLPRYKGDDYYALNFKTSTNNAITKMDENLKQLKNTLIKPKAEQKYYYPHLAYTAADSKQVADIGPYNNYAYQMRMQFITGTLSIENDWDSYVNTMKSTYKIDTVIKTENTVYKRYKAWLATK